MIPERLVNAIKTGRVVLFLGAGANYNCTLNNGERVPMANRLSELLSENFDVRKAPDLAQTAELVEAKHNRSELNAYIVALLTGARASEGFKLIRTFRWASIYTTNYDLLVEDIYKDSSSLQNINVYYTSTQKIDLGPNDLPLYKIHGCISQADTDEGRLVITPDDYADHRRNRARLFNRLADQLCDKPFLYLGYGRQDPNFRNILADVHNEMNGDIPEGFALFPGKTSEDEMLWERKGIHLIDMDVDLFLKELDKLLPNRNIKETPKFNFPILKQYESLSSEEMENVLSTFSLPIPNYGDRINASNFYKGSEAKWIDIQNKVDAERDVYEEIMNNLLEDALSIDYSTTVYTVLAEAGSGKSTLLRRLAYDICHDFNQFCLWYNGDRNINFDLIKNIFEKTEKRIFVFVDRASKFSGNLERISKDCTYAKIPFTMVLVDRTNEWHFSVANNFRVTESWILDRLTDVEIEKILKKLDDFGCLGNLHDFTQEQRVQRFRGYSDRQLLVALREATEGKDFDDLIIEESDSIPNALARQAYLHICALNAFGKGIRTSALSRSLGINIVELAALLKPLEGLVDMDGDLFRARHALIAKIVLFSLGEESRIDLMDQLIRRLDLGYMSDSHIFKSITSNTDLIDNIGNIDNRRRIFEALKYVDPSDAFIEQHEARMEIRSVDDGGSLERAEKLIKNALRRTGNAISIRHTAGLLYRKRAFYSKGFEKRANLSKAVNEFSELTKRTPHNDYVWTGLIDSRLELGNESDIKDVRLADFSRAEADYQKAIENCGTTPFLLKAKGRIEAYLGNGEEARSYFKKAIANTAPPVELLINYINWELRHKNIDDARNASERAYKLYNTKPEILILRAKSLILGSGWQMNDVASLLIEAQRSSSGYIALEAHYWHGVALWECERYSESLEKFKTSKELALSLQRGDTKNIRYISGVNEGFKKEYSGSVVEHGARSNWLLCNPGGVKVYVHSKYIDDIRTRKVKFNIGFNRFGPVAMVVKQENEFLFDNIL